MESLEQLTNVLLVLIPAGVAARIIYCLCQIPLDEEQRSSHLRRIRNAILFLVAAECAAGLLRLAEAYLLH